MQITKKRINELFEKGLANISDEERKLLLSLEPRSLTKKQNDLIKEFIIKDTIEAQGKLEEFGELDMLLSVKSVDDFYRLQKNNSKKRVNLIVGSYLKYELETVSRMLGISLNETINILLEDRLKPIRQIQSFKEYTEVIVFDDHDIDENQ